MSAHSPYRWTGMIAFVRGPITAATSSARIINVSGSTSTKTGRAPTRATEPAVAKNENVGVMTSSPGPIPRAINDIEERVGARGHPDRKRGRRSPSAISRSNASTSGPRMNCCELAHALDGGLDLGPDGAYCAVRSRSGTRSEAGALGDRGTMSVLWLDRVERWKRLTQS